MTRYVKLLALLFIISQSIFMQKAYSQDVELDPHTIWYKTDHSMEFVRFSLDGTKLFFLDGKAFMVRDASSGEVLHIGQLELAAIPISFQMEFDTIRRRIYIPRVDANWNNDFFSTLAVFDMDTYERLPDFEGVKADGKGATEITLSPDGNFLAVKYGGYIIDGKQEILGIRVFDLNTGKVISRKEWDYNTSETKYLIKRIKFDESSRNLYVPKHYMGVDMKGIPKLLQANLEIWDANSLDSVGTVLDNVEIYDLKISPDWKYIAGTNTIIDLEQNKVILQIKSGVAFTSFTNDNKYYIIAHRDYPYGINVWDLEKKEIVYSYKEDLKKTIYAFDYSPLTNNLVAVRGNTYYLGLPQGVSVEAQNNEFVFNVFPNPIQSGTYTANFILDKSEPVELYLSDILGNKLKYYINGMMEAGTHQIPIEVSNLANGVYFLSLQINDRIYTEKMIVE